MKAAISVRELTKTYEEGATGTLALRGVDLDAHAGEVLMLVGPSGSGKTTLLSIMGCILTATSGSVRIAGREVVGLREKQLPAIRLQQHRVCVSGIQPVSDFVGRRERGTDARFEGSICGGVEEAGAGTARSGGTGRKVCGLSGGPERRTEAAHRDCAGAGGDPEIILADEPTAALDSHTGRNVMEMMSELAHKSGRRGGDCDA